MPEEEQFVTQYYLDRDNSIVCEGCMNEDKKDLDLFGPYTGPFRLNGEVELGFCEDCGVEIRKE